MDKTKIEWCDSTWNPVTGCLHGCKYCYARKIAERFAPYEIYDPEIALQRNAIKKGGLNGAKCPIILDYPWQQKNKSGTIQDAAYPFGFMPTFHRYRMDEPTRWKTPHTIFVCSMADLFGEWVPDEWIQEIFATCEGTPQHQYLFLTKNPKRYAALRAKGIDAPANSWIGTSVTTSADAVARTLELSECWNTRSKGWFVSVEPILEEMSSEALEDLSAMHWIIIGAETGNRKEKVAPQKAWIDEICKAADIAHTPVFMKNSLLPIMGKENMRREFPWDVKEAGA